MSDRQPLRGERGGQGESEAGAGKSGPGDSNSLVTQPQSPPPESITTLLSKLVAQVAPHLAPGLRRTLEAGLRRLTEGRERKTAFMVLYALGVALVGGLLMVVDLVAGSLLSPAMVAGMLLFGSYLFAVLTTGVAVAAGWLITPEEEAIRAVKAKGDARLQLLADQERHLEASGRSRAEIEAEIGPRRRHIFDEQWRALDRVLGSDDPGEGEAPRALNAGKQAGPGLASHPEERLADPAAQTAKPGAATTKKAAKKASKRPPKAIGPHPAPLLPDDD